MWSYVCGRIQCEVGRIDDQWAPEMTERFDKETNGKRLKEMVDKLQDTIKPNVGDTNKCSPSERE